MLFKLYKSPQNGKVFIQNLLFSAQNSRSGMEKKMLMLQMRPL